MSRIDKLIAELCPNGVEYKTIQETVGVNRGKRLTKSQLSDDGEYEVYHGSKDSILGRYNQYNAPANTTIVVNTGGIGGVKFLNKPFWCSDGCFWLGQIDYIDNKYLYYCLSGYEDYFYSQKRVGGIPTIDRSVVENFKIPVPPLEVQSEIVRILDAYSASVTALQQELEKELTARKKQYEYYRDLLLNFGVRGGTVECEWRTIRLGNICSVITKGTTPKSYEKLGVSFIKTESFSGRYIDKDKLSFISEKTHTTFLKRSILQENDILFTIAGATIGKMAIVTKNLLPANTNQALAIIRLKDKNDLGYIKFMLESEHMKKYMSLCIKGSAQPNLNLQQLNNFSFPYPTIEERTRIVNILDRFDKLCNDISEGLPAEIEARRKQYEYYRDKLLSFEELRT